jgi:predicted RNA-binding Zn ribbon-like protein
MGGDAAPPHAPGQLEQVRAFVNSVDLEADQEQLGTPADLDAWSRKQGLGPALGSDSELDRVLELREALRTVLRSHHHPAVDTEHALQVINEGLRWGDVAPSLTAESLTWTSASEGVPGLVGQLLSAVLSAEAAGHWSRLKACSNDACQWAFYDHSRSRTGRWCSMQICGNRAKQQRFQRANASEPESQAQAAGSIRGVTNRRR